ncbi:MAG: inositol monophosphatase family protein, partial [Pseudomonadota bacterium]
IDGTRGFMSGLPTWGVLIALADGDGPFMGMMAQPFVGERFYASPDGVFHSWSRGTAPMRTRPCKRLEDAVIACTAMEHFDDRMRQSVIELSKIVRLVRYGTDCYGYAMLAAGHVDIVLETGLKPYDIAPFAPIIAHAGGALVDRSGAPVGPQVLNDYSGDGVAVGDPSLLDALLAHL